MSFGFTEKTINDLEMARNLPPKNFETLIFDAHVPVVIKVEETKGVQVASNGNHYMTLHGTVHPSSIQHAGKKLVHLVWEKSLFAGEKQEDFDKKLCPLQQLLSGYFTTNELLEDRWNDEQLLIQRVLGSMLEMIPKKPYIKKKDNTMDQGFYGFKVHSPIAGVNVDVNPVAVSPVQTQVVTEGVDIVPF